MLFTDRFGKFHKGLFKETMGIIKKAKNINIIVNGNYTLSSKTITKQANKITITTTKGDLVLSSNKKIVLQAQDEIKFGDYIPPTEILHPNIVDMQFLDENGKILKNENIERFGGIYATNFLYGKKLKIKFFTKDVQDCTLLEFKLKGKSNDDCQDFFQIDKLKWNLEVNNNTCETDFFTLNTLWYSENSEKYNYALHRTEIEAQNLNTYSVEGVLDCLPFQLPEKREDDLRPIAYLRNYEELIGLFDTNNSGNKSLIDNYENKFISYDPEILKISSEFSDYLNYTDNLSLNKIKEKVKIDSKKLWESAVKRVQAGNLDDRPLYWARNKMQVRLKRNALFANDINFLSSTVKEDSELEKIIKIFEEQSRNYTNIDFSKAGNKKKVLITGFDPFILNQFDNPDFIGNILQSNPSGCIALALKDINIANCYIQSLIVPVRYSDFDGSQDNATGQGEGIIEKYIKAYIHEVDMIITISQYLPNENVIDMFGTLRRGGFNDNEDFKREDGSKAISNKMEWIKTTLPRTFANVPFVKFNWKFDGVLHVENTVPKQDQVLKQGSGGDYLSNEIFYRVGKLRNEMRPTLATGHFHIEKLQGANEDLKDREIKRLLNIVKESIEEGVKGI